MLSWSTVHSISLHFTKVWTAPHGPAIHNIASKNIAPHYIRWELLKHISTVSTARPPVWPFEGPGEGHAPRCNQRDKGQRSSGEQTSHSTSHKEKLSVVNGGHPVSRCSTMSFFLLADRNLSLALLCRTVSISWAVDTLLTAGGIIAPSGPSPPVVLPPVAVNIRHCLVPTVRVHRTHLQSSYTSAVFLHTNIHIYIYILYSIDKYKYINTSIVREYNYVCEVHTFYL